MDESQKILFENLFVDYSKEFEYNRLFLGKMRGLSEKQLESINTYEELINLFSESTQDDPPRPHGNRINNWAHTFARDCKCSAYYPNPLNLDPFIARYIIAINKSGVKTYLSCDGIEKHKKELYFDCNCRNSSLWHRYILTFIPDEYSIDWINDYPGETHWSILLKSNEKMVFYKKLNRTAKWLEDNSKYFFSEKQRLIKLLHGKPKNMLSNEDMYELMVHTLAK